LICFEDEMEEKEADLVNRPKRRRKLKHILTASDGASNKCLGGPN
jgi:hypothetical protein